MPDFEHLTLFRIVETKPYVGQGGGPKKGARTRYNLEHRQEHFDNLTSQLGTLQTAWQENISERENQGLPPLDNADVMPVFLQIDLTAKDIEALKGFGIDIISEEDDGYIIGASSVQFQSFIVKLEQFLTQSNQKFQDSAGSILAILTDPNARLRKIVTPDLFSKWEELEEQQEIVVYVAISSYLKIPDYPTQGAEQSNERYEAAIERYKVRYQEWMIAKDELADNRQTAFENIIRPYNAEFITPGGQYVDFDDGFGCKIRISGRGLKDLARNFPYVFNIEEHDSLISYRGTSDLERLLEIEISAPMPDDPRVCIIDSGIDEAHRLLAPAVDNLLSISYVPGDADRFDKVDGGGHGTRVAGASLFPSGFGELDIIQAPFWLQNARILDNHNMLDSTLDEASLMRVIVDRFTDTKIFNLSVSNRNPASYVHMPIWAATIDKLIWQKDILFCIAAGNIGTATGITDRPGITDFYIEGLRYPAYLRDRRGMITNPALSCFAITVGSISNSDFENDSYKFIGGIGRPSAFSRSGPGLWGMIKPDVVEYGGDFVYDKNDPTRVIIHEDTCTELIRSTRDGGPAVGRDTVGTSFTTPKVSHIAAILQKLYPQENCLLYRALIIQSARLPVSAFGVDEYIRHYGYGIPMLDKASTNSQRRVTLYNSGSVNPKNTDIYLVRIPNEITRPGYNFEILIEITLSYKAEPRITRRKTNSYLSAWLDWETSRKGEDIDIFTDRIKNEKEEIELDENGEEIVPEVTDEIRAISFRWTIGSRTNSGEILGIKRQASTVQKDWCRERSNQLPPEFLIAVRGHKGWEKDIDKKVPYSIVVSFEILDPQIDINLYELIRIENQIEVETELRV